MHITKLWLFLATLYFPLVNYAQEIPEPLIPTERVTYGNHNHTSRDAIFFSEKDSQGNLIVAGYTERDFTFSDIKIVSLDKNLEENWSDRLSWNGISYDYPIDLMIDEKDHVWVISKNYFQGTRANFVINRYSPSGEMLWEYKSPETVDWSTLNMNQYYYFFDAAGNLNFTYQKEQEFDTNRSFFKISPAGVVSNQYSVIGPLSKLIHYEDHYLGLSLKYIEEVETLYFMKFNENETNNKILDFTSHQLSRIRNTLFEQTTTAFTDSNGNYIYLGDGNFHDNAGFLHPGLFLFSISNNYTVNFFLDDDGGTDKYLLDATVNQFNEILILTNSKPIEDDGNEPSLTLEKYSQNGELLFKERIKSVTGNVGKIEEDQIVIRTLSGKIQNYDLELNLLQSFQESTTENYFHLQDIHSANSGIYLVGTTISAKYEGSDYNSEENFHIKKFTNENLSAEYSFNGEGTSKYYNYEMIRNPEGDYLVSCREFIGPNNLNLGGSKAPFSKKVMRFNSNLEYQDQETVAEEFDLWEKPAYNFEAENGDKYKYEIDENRRKVSFYLNGDLAWNRTLNFDGNSYMEAGYNNAVDKEGNFLVTSSLYGNHRGKIHRLSPENEYSFIETGEPALNLAVLSNNWIFTILNDYSIKIYSPELELISERQYDEYFFFQEWAPTLMEKNNKILLNVRNKKLVMVFDQFGDYKSRFTLEGLLHPSVAIFDENDALNVYHTVGQGLYTEHGYNWTRLAISRYGNIIEDYIGKMPDGDKDEDGVSDFMDRCPNTIPGKTVNQNGCAVIELPADNFELLTRDETCVGKNNGEFVINVAQEHDYIVTLNGEKHEFRLGMSFEALSPGVYNACIEVRDEPQTKQCFEFEINPGDTFEAENRIQNKAMLIEVKQGTAPFQVKINGIKSRTFHSNNFEIPVEDGDIVEVSSAIQCEGTTSILANLNSVMLSSNPVDQFAEVILPQTGLKNIHVKIFDSSGKLISSENLSPNYKQNLEVDTSSLSPGVYYLHIQLEKHHSVKLIKR